MLKITTHSLDTCGCVINYQWDTDTPQDQRTHTPVEQFVGADGKTFTTTRCKYHQIANLNSLHSNVITENQFKNQALDEVAKALGTTVDKVDLSWDLDDTRKLKVKLNTETAGNKAKALTAVLKKWPANKIDIQ